jgi:hypothetical protein
MGINDGFTGDKIGSFTEYQMMSGHNGLPASGSRFKGSQVQIILYNKVHLGVI